MNISFHIIYFAVSTAHGVSADLSALNGATRRPATQLPKKYLERRGYSGPSGGPTVPNFMSKCYYYLYVGNRREKAVSRRLQKAKKARGFSINVINEYPGYLEVGSVQFL